MRGSAKRQLLLYVLAIALIAAVAAPTIQAASVGQIKGVIRDKETKEPVIGASVVIKGTKFGGLTNFDGAYQILRVEVGTYTLVVSSVEYNTVEITNTVVNADLTTEQNISLTKKVSQLDVKIEVTAKTDIISKYETANQQTITQEQIKSRPVTTVDNLLKNVAGVQTGPSGQVFVRGGRAGEVSYIVDGVPLNDPLGGLGQAGANLSLVSGSIQEIQIIKDGFDPEYGNALSGIVKITTQTGNKDNTKVNMQYISDDFGNASMNKYSRNSDFVRFSVSGPDPLLKNRILPALGLKFLEDKEFTYYLYAEVEKNDGVLQYEDYNTPTTRRNYDNFDFLGIDIPERLYNRYNWMLNLKFRPKQNMNFLFSYKTTQIRATVFDWNYRYTPNTAPVREDNSQSVSLEVSQELSRNMNYEANFSYYIKEVSQKPQDPLHPGVGLEPDDFRFDYEWESYIDRNTNGVYDAPEPIINLFPDSANYGTDFNGPGYSFGEFLNDINSQGGSSNPSDFRFNSNGYTDSLEGEPFIDLNGNGVWDQGDFLTDKNGNGQLDADRISPINRRTAEPYNDGDSIIGEPFTDVNRNGVYDFGIDLFVRSAGANNQDLNHNGIYDGPTVNGQRGVWEPGIPFEDRNGNGVYDFPNSQYDIGERFTDLNGNNKYDYGSSSNFLDPVNFDEDAEWQQRETRTLRGEVKVFRQMGRHQIKAGVAVAREDFTYEDISRPYLEYTGRPDSIDGEATPFGDRGAFRDFFKYQPISGTVYFRDNLEYGSMIASLGLRWDFFLQDTKKLIPIAQSDESGEGLILGDRQKISPRIGFSYPISDKAKVHFNYGHFFQLPLYQYMYARNTASVDQNDVVGNYNLDYQKTIQYSFGVKYAVTENYAVDLAGYFKDEFDKINPQEIREGGLTRQQYRNSDYGRSRGFELTIEKVSGGYVSGQLSYTYAFAYGKASQTRENYLSDFELSREPLSESPLDNDIRHSLKAYVSLYVPSTVKPRLFGVPIFSGWSLSIESVIESGRPFTPTSLYPGIATEAGVDIGRNSLRLPSTAVFDLRFQKEFRLVGLDLAGILWVDNVFNSRNVVSVYAATGRPDTEQNSGEFITGGTEYNANPANWDYGRQVKLGLEVNL